MRHLRNVIKGRKVNMRIILYQFKFVVQEREREREREQKNV